MAVKSAAGHCDNAHSDALHVAEDIRVAETLPARVFTSPEFLEQELRTLFTRTWLLVPQLSAQELREDARALTDRLKTRGARLPFTLLDQPFFLQKGWEDRKLRCFPNVCTHAWYPLVHGPGRSRTITCAQHGRNFDCTGRFLSQPGFKDSPEFPRDCDHLASLPVESWGQFLFVCLGRPATSIDRFLGELKNSVSRLPLVDFRRNIQSDEVREVAGNWKQHAWNYMDKFHIPFIHKAPGGLADAVELESYHTELYDYSSLQWAYARNPNHGFDPDHLPARFSDPKDPRKRVLALWWFIFPNMTLNFYPWGLSVNVYQPVPGRPDTTLFHWYSYVFDRVKARLKDRVWLSSQVDAEDVDAMSQTRRGTRSRFAVRGRFSPKDEAGPHWFHRLVAANAAGQDVRARIVPT